MTCGVQYFKLSKCNFAGINYCTGKINVLLNRKVFKKYTSLYNKLKQ